MSLRFLSYMDELKRHPVTMAPDHPVALRDSLHLYPRKAPGHAQWGLHPGFEHRILLMQKLLIWVQETDGLLFMKMLNQEGSEDLGIFSYPCTRKH